MYRQGDLLIVPVSAVVKTQHARSITNGVIQEGEATGHAHRLENGEAWQDRGETFIASAGLALLTHDEHDTITLPEGTFKVIRQKEWAPEGERVVRD